MTDPRLQQLAERVKRLAERFQHVIFSRVRRTDPELARASRHATEALRARMV